MENKLRDYIEDLFKDAPKTRKAYELKEEMIANLIEKYRDLIAEGKNEEAAYNIAVSSIGDISELIDSLRESSVLTMDDPKERRKSALIVSAAVMLYILSLVVLIFIEEVLRVDNLGIIAMFLFVAVATGMLIYNYMSKPRYIKADDSLVEEFKEWKARKDSKIDLSKSIISVMWTFIVAIYLIINFVFGIWHISWVIFIIGAGIEQMIKAYFEMKR